MDVNKKWKTLAIISTCLLILVSFLYAQNLMSNKTAEPEPANETIENEQTEEQAEENWLSLWNDDAPAKAALEEYVKDVTDPASANFIPLENRVAVFDLDGTLFCETDPVYFDHMLLMHRVLEDPNHTASEFELMVADKIQEFIDTGKSASDLMPLHGQAVASAFAGMTIKEFYDYVAEFAKTPSPGYNNMNRGDAFYLPMVEVIDYLQNNDFQCYIVSGTDRLIVRGAVQGLSFLNIPPRQIIGSDETIVTKNQGDTDGLDYLYDKDDELVLGGDFIVKNLKMNKVAVIAQEIGQQPVLSFGNSTGDSSMAEYVTSNNPFRSMAFMLCCDDTERENGNVEKADKMFSLCEEYGWTPVSMKNDWTTIYGDSVTRKTDAE